MRNTNYASRWDSRYRYATAQRCRHGDDPTLCDRGGCDEGYPSDELTYYNR